MAEYINRNDLLDVINANIAEAHNERCSQLLEAILNAPIADVAEVRHGTWKISFDGYYPYCPECGNEPKSRTMTEYCEKCGTKLDKPKECVK